jgi:hypothetical protein
MPVILSIQGFLDGSKSAMLTVSVPQDRYQTDPDGPWQPVSQLTHGDNVHAVNHFGRQFSRVGTVTSIRSLETKAAVERLITSITLVEVARITPQDITDLGYKTQQDWLNDWGMALEKRWAWLIRLLPVSATTPQ